MSPSGALWGLPQERSCGRLPRIGIRGFSCFASAASQRPRLRHVRSRFHSSQSLLWAARYTNRVRSPPSVRKKACVIVDVKTAAASPNPDLGVGINLGIEVTMAALQQSGLAVKIKRASRIASGRP